MGTSHGKKDEITLKLCSFNPTKLGFSLFWWVRLKKCGIPRTEGPHSALTPWAKSQTRLPSSSSESNETL